MKRLLKIVLFAAIVQLFFAHSVFSQENVPLREVLDNGMTVVLLENHNAPVATIQTWVNTGSVKEGKFLGCGVSHFVEHMLFKGTKRRPVGEVGKEVKEAGGETNAYTGDDKTVYFITFHSDNFDKVLDIMSDVIMNSTFDPTELEKEREVIVKEINMNRDDPFRRLYMLAEETAYAVHPYRYPVIGYESLFRSLTRDDVVSYYKRMYVPNNMAFVVVGDFDTEKVLPKIKEAFRDFKREPFDPPVLPQEPRQEGPRSVMEQFEVTVAQSMMGFHSTNLYSDDMYPMDVLAIILGGGDTSRLYRELRQKRGIVYSIGATSETPKDPGMFWIMSSFEPEKFQAVKDAVKEQIEKVKAEDVSQQELETARAKVLSDYFFSRESVEGQARSLGTGELDAHDIFFDKLYVDRIAKVTAQDIRRVADKYFRDENSVSATLMPVGKMPSAGAEQEKAGAAPQIEKTVLPNGLTLLLRNDPSTETVSIRASILGGARAEDKSDTGITNLMSSAMLKGTTKRSADQIATAIESRGGSISSFAGYNSFGFNVEMLSRDVNAGLEILGDVLANPTFPPQEVSREKTAAIAGIKSINDEIVPSALHLFRQTMFDDYPYGFLVEGNVDVVQALTPEQLKKFQSESVVASRMVLSVFGNIKKSEVLKSIEKNFGQLKKGTPLQAPSASGPPLKEVKTANKQMNKEQLAILVGFPGITVTDPNRYVLEVLSASLNSQGGKLFEVLRDQRGLAYEVGAFNILGIDPGAFVFYIISIPQKREDSINGMLDVIRDLRANGISDEDLTRTKVELLGNHAIGLQTNAQFANVASFDELYGLGYDTYKEYDSKIRAVTADDIKRVASSLLDMDHYVLVIVGNVGPK